MNITNISSIIVQAINHSRTNEEAVKRVENLVSGYAKECNNKEYEEVYSVIEPRNYTEKKGDTIVKFKLSSVYVLLDGQANKTYSKEYLDCYKQNYKKIL